MAKQQVKTCRSLKSGKWNKFVIEKKNCINFAVASVIIGVEKKFEKVFS